jgi:NADH-quinone oxidoreductase subunit J
MMGTMIFYLLATLVVVPALLVVTVRNMFHAALWLVLSLVAVAGVYALLAADFLFAVQILVYAGGIMVVMLFVVLLSGKPSDWNIPQHNEQIFSAGLFSLLFMGVIGATLALWPLMERVHDTQPTTKPLGELLLGEMLLPLEVVGLVMVVGLIGAIFFSSKKTT